MQRTPQLQTRQPAETIMVETARFACDGGTLGHPRVFLTLDKNGEVDCPYCGRHYVLKEGAGAHGAHE